MSQSTTSFKSANSRHRDDEEAPKNHTQEQELKIERSTHLGITIRWGVEAAAPASTVAAADARC